jgi:hypothetical protein
MPYTQKEGAVYGEDDGVQKERGRKGDEAKEGNKNGTWVFSLSLVMNNSLSLSRSMSLLLCLSK